MKFGDVVQYESKEYVYLAATDEIIYLAIVPNEEDSKELISLCDKVHSQGSKNKLIRRDSIAWCFIALSTDKFKNRVAFYGKPDQDYDPDDIFDLIGSLNIDDQIKIKGEITKDNGVANELRMLVKDIIIENK